MCHLLPEGKQSPQIQIAFQAIDGTLVLDNGDSLKAITDISGSVQATISYMQISNNEGQ